MNFKPNEIYYEKPILNYELGKILMKKYEDIPKIEIDNHNNIEQMRKKEKYNWQHVQAYSIIALNNLLNSANDITLENMQMIIEPLDLLHTKKDVIEYAEKLLKNKNN